MLVVAAVHVVGSGQGFATRLWTTYLGRKEFANVIELLLLCRCVLRIKDHVGGIQLSIEVIEVTLGDMCKGGGGWFYWWMG